MNNVTKNNKKVYIIAIVLALALIVTIVSTSYAYFTANINNNTTNNTVVTTGTMKIEYTDGTEISLEKALPGTYVEKTFKVKNVGTLETTYDIYLSDLINTFVDKSDLTYTLTSNDGGESVMETQMPDVSTKIVDSKSIGINEEHNYTLRIDFKETNDNQDDNKGKIFSTVIRINEVKIGIKDSVIGSIMNKNYSNENSLDSYTIEEMTYPVRVYSYSGNQEWTTSTVPNGGIFGEAADIATESTNAQRMVIVKVDGDLTIGEGVTIQPYYSSYGGPKGFALIVSGTLTNNGTIDNSHGAKAEGEKVYLWQNLTYENENDKYEFVPAEGGAGAGTKYASGTNVRYAGANGNSSTVMRGTGGGGSGSVFSQWSQASSTSGAGGKGTSYSGGAGGGAATSSNGSSSTGGAGSSYGGAGGNGSTHIKANTSQTQGAGGGAGNPGGIGSSNSYNNNNFSGPNGTGGLLIIYANNVFNGVNGTITANGHTGGGIRVTSSTCNYSSYGGSSGGGSINIFYINQYINNNTSSNNGISSLGGISNTQNCDNYGGAGGNGSITIGSVESGNFVVNS